MNRERTVEDFTRCPDVSCQHDSPVDVDYYDGGDELFLEFSCPECSPSSLEDDFEWFVQCPECDNEQENLGRVEHINGGVTQEGKIWFECQECGVREESLPETKWNDTS